MDRTALEEVMGVESIAGAAAMQGTAQNADAARLQQQVTAIQQQAAQEAAQAARDAALAGREAALDGARAQRDAQRAMRDVQREMTRVAREGQPTVVFPPFPGSGPQIPEGVVIISVAFFVMCAVIAIGFPIARAIARRMDKRGAASSGTDSESRARLERIEQAIDAIAIEVERVSEGQRFTTKLLGEIRALPQPDPSVPIGDRDRGAVPLSRAREAR